MHAGRIAIPIACMCLCGMGWADNLLRNAGFEDDDGSGPAYWNVFVMPMFGAEGVVDSNAAAEGFRSVRLHTPAAYTEEPANNWSQNVSVDDVAGKEVRLSGALRSEDVTYASLWLQCCTKRPFRVLRQDSSFDVHPIKGTRGWTRVSMTVLVPERTEFLIVRCVIQGAGTVWFDDLQLTVEESAPVVTPPEAKVATPSEATIADETDRATKPESPVIERPIPPTTPRPESPTPVEVAPETVTNLIELNSALRDTVRELRQSNTTMSDEIRAHRDEIERLKDEMLLLRDALEYASQESRDAAGTEIRRVPPLVPGSNPNGDEGP